MKKIRSSRIISMVMVLVMAVTMITAVPASAAELSTPTALDDGNSNAGFISSWSCIWFGNYPQSEITSGSEYNALKKASSSQWSNNTIWINGSRYLRMKGNDSLYNKDMMSISGQGYYPYKGDGETYHYFKFEPIKWRVLEINSDNIVVVSDKILDAAYWHTDHNDYAKWYNSTIRSWLNGYSGSYNLRKTDYSSNNFMDLAFTANEKSAIMKTSVNMQNHPDFIPNTSGHGKGGNDTSDYVYLLAQRDVHTTQGNARAYGFDTSSSQSEIDENRYCKATTYANARGVQISTGSKTSGNGSWWLRSPAIERIDAQNVDLNYSWINEPNMDSLSGVRPVVRIKYGHEAYCYAGTVNWKKANETAPDFYTKWQCSHVMQKTAAKPATMSSNGNVEYYTCLGCNKLFTDAAGSKQYARPQTVIHRIGSVKPTTSVYYYNKDYTRNPGVTITDINGKTIDSSGYTLTRNKQKYVGKYDLTVKFKGKYSGSTKVSYEIRPSSAPSIKKLKKGKKSFTLTWSKQKTQSSGYQIGYTTSKSFKNLSYKTITNLNTTESTVKNLKSKKTYYVSIRTYKTVKYNGKSIKLYSGWYKAKSVKTK